MTAPDKILVNLASNDDSCCPVEDASNQPEDFGKYFSAESATSYTRTDLAQAAVAAAYEAAAQVCDSGNAGAFWGKAIRYHAPDQIAALAAERAATVTVKPLEWVKDTMPNAAPQRYRAATHDGTGDYSVSGSKNSDAWQWFRNGYFVDGHQHHKPMPLDAAKAAAKADYDARIRSAITITSGDAPDTLAKSDDFVSLPRAEVGALMELLRRAKHCIGDNYLHWQGEVGVALATLQERMK